MKIIISPITKELLEKYLAVPDLTQQKENHAVKQLYLKIKGYMTEAHPKSELREYHLNPVVKVEENFDNLLISKDNISRASTYTHYVTENTVLRAHTTAHLPTILAELAQDPTWEDVVILLPGLVYRRDVTDKKHLGVIHHVEVWRIVKNSSRNQILRNELLDIINGLAKICAPGWSLRNVNKIHPYTTEGVEANLVKGDQDIEILEAGLINPQILVNAGLDPNKYSGWAMGMGLDRLVMTLKEIPDIRYLRSSNPQIAVQMTNLDKYIEVSNQPAIRRDMSYCVPKAYVDEDIHEEIRNAMGSSVDILESVEILNQIASKDLPKAVQEKLGCTKDYKNVLVRITLRSLEKTLTNEEANSLYSRIYEKVNYGKAIYS